MDPEDIMRGLREEGFSHVLVWTDAPNAVYPAHVHEAATAGVVLEGEITVTTPAGRRTYGPGERFDVAAGEVHQARTGPRGCAYVIGER